MSEPVGEWDARRHPEGLATSRSIRSQGHLYGPFPEEKAVIKDHKCTKNPFGHSVNKAFLYFKVIGDALQLIHARFGRQPDSCMNDRRGLEAFHEPCEQFVLAHAHIQALVTISLDGG